MVGGVGSYHATPECRAKLILTENPDIIFTDLHSSLKKKKKKSKGEGKKKPCNHLHHFCEIARCLNGETFFSKSLFSWNPTGQGQNREGDEANVKAQIFSSLRRLPNPPQGQLLVRNIVNKGQQCAVQKTRQAGKG